MVRGTTDSENGGQGGNVSEEREARWRQGRARFLCSDARGEFKRQGRVRGSKNKHAPGCLKGSMTTRGNGIRSRRGEENHGRKEDVRSSSLKKKRQQQRVGKRIGIG